MSGLRREENVLDGRDILYGQAESGRVLSERYRIVPMWKYADGDKIKVKTCS